MKIYKKLKQLSDEWFALRAGKLTGSNAQAIAANGKGLETLAYTMLAEKYSKNRYSFTNPDIERGIELEDQARQTYRILHDDVEEVGFVEMDEYVGCSPDGLIGKDGGLEIKCVNDVNFFRLLVNGSDGIEYKYLWQVQMSLLVTKRKWWDLVFYNPNYDKSLLSFRFTPNGTMQTSLLNGIEKGKKIMADFEKKYQKGGGKK